MGEIGLEQHGALDRDIVALDEAAFITLDAASRRAVLLDIEPDLRRRFAFDAFAVGRAFRARLHWSARVGSAARAAMESVQTR